MEEWKEIPGFSSRYGKYYIRKDGVAKNGKGWILLVRPHYKGYKMIRMIKNGRSKATNVMIHRAVCLAWLPNPDNKPQINHKNGIKTDNRLENLEWCTNSENQKHAVDMGLRVHYPLGHPFYVKKGFLNEDQVKEIRAAVISKNGRGGVRREDLCKKFGVSIHVIKDVRANKSYRQ